MVNIAVFASGSGTNAAAMADYFSERETGKVCLVVTNNPGAGVIVRSLEREIPVIILEDGDLGKDEFLLELKNRKIELIVLAGFLKLIPAKLIDEFPNRILNIHPALLPEFGGKGMYGGHVHKAVSKSGNNESGISIHLVNEEYDKGSLIAQFKIPIGSGEDPASIEKKVRKLELANYPEVVENFILSSGLDDSK